MSEQAPLTAKTVGEKIDSLEYGEYDSLHEWNPSYSYEDKVSALGEMLSAWSRADADARKLILQNMRTLVHSDFARYRMPLMCALALQYASEPEIAAAVEGLTASALFSRELLVAMKNNGLTQEAWISRIRRHCEDKTFSENKKELKRDKIYERIEGLLGGF